MPLSSVDDPIEVGNFYRAVGGGVLEVTEIKDGRISFVEHRPLMHAKNLTGDWEASTWTAENADSFLSMELSRTIARLNNDPQPAAKR